MEFVKIVRIPYTPSKKKNLCKNKIQSNLKIESQVCYKCFDYKKLLTKKLFFYLQYRNTNFLAGSDSQQQKLLVIGGFRFDNYD